LRVPFIPYIQGRNGYVDRDGHKYALAFHCTANDAPARAEAAYAARRTDGISSHFYVDKVEVIQSLDTDLRAGHAGSTPGNENGICFELSGTNGKSRTWWVENINWALLGRVCAAVIREEWSDGSFRVRRATVAQMQADPRVKACYGHNDMRLAWGGTTHTDPGPNFPWDVLFDAINTAMGETTGDDDMFCRHGDKGPKVESLQRMVVAAGGTVGAIDGSYGDNTANGLKALVGGGDGRYYGPTEYAAVHVALARKNGSGTPGPQGAPGPAGPAGAPGRTASKVRISGDFPVVEVV
jgi:N-acetyl-anhydromuramyl-L-alanine amidase AmpD